MARLSPRYEALVGERKDTLLSGLGGTVVEIGPGTGPNLRYLAPGARWLGIEPNRHMAPYLRTEARKHGVRARIVGASADALPLPDARVDAVVSTLVLCSLDRPERALAEIRRVLRPGGAFLFVEHVGAPHGSLLRRLQRAIRPLWKTVADGCRPDRDTLERIRNAGFRRVEAERFRLRLPLVSPHVAGRAVR